MQLLQCVYQVTCTRYIRVFPSDIPAHTQTSSLWSQPQGATRPFSTDDTTPFLNFIVTTTWSQSPQLAMSGSKAEALTQTDSGCDPASHKDMSRSWIVESQIIPPAICNMHYESYCWIYYFSSSYNTLLCLCSLHIRIKCFI